MSIARRRKQEEEGVMFTESMRRLTNYCKDGDIHNMMRLISGGASVNGSDVNGETPVHVAASEGRLPVLKYLVSEGARVHARDLQGQQPVHKAASGGHVAASEFLVSRGSQVDSEDNEKNQPLHLACKNGRTSEVKYLLSRGSDVNASNLFGDQPIHIICWEGHASILPPLLSQGANTETPGKFGERPLHTASERGHSAVVKLLLSHGADVCSRTSRGRQPLHWAAEAGHLEVVQLLLGHGADKEGKDNEGWRPLHTAASMGQHHIAAVLIKHGANVQAVNNKGETPKELAKYKNNGRVLRVLASQSEATSDRTVGSENMQRVDSLLVKAFPSTEPSEGFRRESDDKNQAVHSINGSLRRQLDSVKEAWSSITTTMTGIPRRNSQTKMFPIGLGQETENQTTALPGMRRRISTSPSALPTIDNGAQMEAIKTKVYAQSSHVSTQTNDLSKAHWEYIIEDLSNEIRRQDRYLAEKRLRRVQITPDLDCFFRAAEESTRCHLPHYTGTGFDLRREVVGHLYAWPEKYSRFDDLNGDERRRSRLERLREQGTWPEYECFLALSRVLKTGIRVTYGGNEKQYQPVTDEFYAYEGLPDYKSWIHIAWLSLGYYDAVVKDTYIPNDPRGIDNVAYLLHHGDMGKELAVRTPCHIPPRTLRRLRSASRFNRLTFNKQTSCDKNLPKEKQTSNDGTQDVFSLHEIFPAPGMEFADKRRLRINRVKIIQDLRIEDISDLLISEGVTNKKHIQTILNSHPNDQSRAGALLDLLETRGPRAYAVFKRSLKSQYEWLIRVLDATQL